MKHLHFTHNPKWAKLLCKAQLSSYALTGGQTSVDSSNYDDAVAIYLSEIGSVQPLSKEEESALFRELAKPGDWGSRELVTRKLIESHLIQVVDIARNHSASGVPFLDLIQEGNLGLMSAGKSFTDNPVGDFMDHAAAASKRP